MPADRASHPNRQVGRKEVTLKHLHANGPGNPEGYLASRWLVHDDAHVRHQLRSSGRAPTAEAAFKRIGHSGPDYRVERDG